MKKLSLIIIVMFFISCKMVGQQNIEIEETDNRTIEEKIIDSIVIVDFSSGVVVKADNNEALILTAYHTIQPKCDEKKCDFDNIIIRNIWSVMLPNDDRKIFAIDHIIREIYFNEELDLAFIKVDSYGALFSVDLGNKNNIRYGEEIFSAGNPVGIVKSLKRGIISAPYRKIHGKIPCFEFDSGTIYGDSGGGVFTKDGKLVGIIQSLRSMRSEICIEKGCLDVPLINIGFAIRLHTIERFIQNSSWCKDFDMCNKKIGENE